MTTKMLWLSAIGMSMLAFAPRSTSACGACFAPPGAATAVDSHRMVVSLSPEQTTLWDQIQYSGNPSEFVWVLPVPSSDAKLELASADFFTQLDNTTVPVVRFAGPYPNLYCASRFPGCPDWAAVYDGGSTADGGVQIFREQVVGPYQTVVIGSEDPAALQDWLTTNGYNVPAETLPVLKHYIDAKSVFIALRLRPGQGVQAMQPVRVTYPGFMGTFPLKMVTVGAAGALDITLWIIAEQRYAPMNYPTAVISADELTWDWRAGGADYAGVFEDKVEAGGGKGWVVQAAHPFSQVNFTRLTPEVEQDIRTARTGLRAPYLTRVRTRALVEHLAEDLVLGPTAETTNVSREIAVTKERNRPDDVVCSNDSNGNGIDDAREQPDCSQPWNPVYPDGPRDEGTFCTTGFGGSASGWLAPSLLALLAGAIVIGRRRIRANRR